YTPAFGSTAGWDFATGLGSVNAYNLVHYWDSADLWLSASASLTSANLLSYALTVGDRGPQGASNVVLSTVVPWGFSLIAGASSNGCTQTGQTVRCAVGALGQGMSRPVTVVIEPSGGAQPVTLSFSTQSSLPDLDPSDGSDTLSINWP